MKKLTNIIMKIKSIILNNNIYLSIFCSMVIVSLMCTFLILGVQTGEYIYSQF
ncbi:hypothetical protein UT300019_31930 [Clostridium sp. CTA-19]